ncbi:unnamed protein product [Durusdinium trenchii]|uniref:C2 domain-containing protein n=1 Tax=Durusdinium trenchii TaxID=1381693 RepID=A0ABP0RKK6_9DINO
MGGTASTEAESTRTKEKSKKKKKKEQPQDDKDLIGADDTTRDAPFEQGATTSHEEWPPGEPPSTVERPPTWPDLAAEPTMPIDDTSPGPRGVPEPGGTPRQPEQRSFGIFGAMPGQSSRPYAELASPSPLGAASPQSTSPLQRAVGPKYLRVRILKAYNLPLQSTGLTGDLADSYVAARVQRQIFRTCCVEREATCVWTEDNEHTFQLHEPCSLELQVMSISASHEEVLGKASLAVHEDAERVWQRHRLPLQGGSRSVRSELELEMLLEHQADTQPEAKPKEELEYQLGPRVFQPQPHALPWQGVRVLELSCRSWTAALCGQVMAACGAEVIRVAFGEEALLQQKKSNAQRGPSGTAGTGTDTVPNAVPRQLHVGKRLAPYNVEDPEELSVLKSELLMGCSLLLTDLCAEELEQMQLGAASLRQQCPWLIFVHASVVGMRADLSNKGVEDAGAFFSLSGLAEQLGHFLGPSGLAAAAAASALFGVCSMAVLRRRCGAPGDRVEMSIFRSGRWCSALGALTGWAAPPAPAEHHRSGAAALAAPPRGEAEALALPFDVEGVARRPGKRAKVERKPQWSVLEPSALLPPVLTPTAPCAAELPLARVAVLEISDEYQVGAMALGALLADLGARVWISTWGSDEEARHREKLEGRKGGREAHAFWEASGLCQLCNGVPMPPGLSELVVAQQALGGVGLALLRQQRTGQGQFVQVSRYRSGLFCQRLAALDPPRPLTSPLLQTLDGRFLRLLGRGHKPHDAWVLLHALGRRESLSDHVGGNMEKARSKLKDFTWEELQKHQDELLACAREWSFQDLAKAFQEKGIDWFVEEMRPMDAEALHRQRAKQLEELRGRQQNAAEKALQMGQHASELKQRFGESKAQAQEELLDRLHDQSEQQRRLEKLREQYHSGVAPVLGVTVDGAQGLASETRGRRISTYCVIEVVNKPFTRLQSPQLQGPSPLWDYTGVISGWAFGDVLKLAVYHREPAAEVDHNAAPASVEHTTVLYLQVAAAYNLINRDSGIMGDASDPYVVAQVGEMVQQTPSVSNELNPVWKERNQFAFNVVDHELDRYLLLQVMNSNVTKDDGLGRVRLDTRSIDPGRWHHYRLKLEEGQGGELEFDVYLKPAEPCKPHAAQDELIGQAEVGMSQFYPHGFEGQLPLFLNSKPTQGILEVFLEVQPQGVKINRSVNRRGSHRRTSSDLSMMSRRSSYAIGRSRSQVSSTDLGDMHIEPRPAGESEKSVLQIRVNSAANLTNVDSGLFGDVSDPYVVLRVANTEQKTEVLKNTLNPVWQEKNLFSFSVGAEDNKVELEVMDSNNFKDVSLGRCELDLRSIQHGMWTRFNEKLVAGVRGELAFDLYFQATEYRLLVAEQGSMLHVRVNNARNLPNTDTGVLGDVSDPYVIVKVGDLQRRTPTIDNNLNPDWQDGNLFTFSVAEEDATMELEVMNANVVRDDSLGTASVKIGDLEPNHWCRLVEKIGQGATVELDAFFKPSEHYHLHYELQQAQKEEKNSLAEAARLSKEVQMAERASKWLENVEENTKMPLSLEEREWVHACGGRNFVAPAWITVTQTQVEALVRAREQHPRPVALFPEASPSKQQQKLRVKLISAFGLATSTMSGVTYCTCEIPLKKESKLLTDPVALDSNPEWRFSRTVKGYAPGDALVMEVYSRDQEEGMTPRADQLLGRAFLPGEKFYPNGFDGLLNLTLGPRPTGATLRVTALVLD